jgi:hypothetical protein
MFHVWPNFGQTGEIGFSFLVLSFLKKIITLEMEVLKAGFNYAPVGKILLYWTESRTVVRHLSFPVNIGWASHLHSLFLIWKLKKLLLQLFDALCSTRIAWFRIQKALINTRGIFFLSFLQRRWSKTATVVYFFEILWAKEYHRQQEHTTTSVMHPLNAGVLQLCIPSLADA